MAPAIGDPIMAANPWNNIKIPNALVNFSIPMRSTAMIERNAEKQATKKRDAVREKRRRVINLSTYYIFSKTFQKINHLPIANPKIAEYVNWTAGVMIIPLNMVARPPTVIATLLSILASTLSNELIKPQNIRATVFEIPITDIVSVAKFSSIPLSFALFAK